MIHLLLAVIYIAFVSLGLPDSLLGSAWPTMYREFGVPVSGAGLIYMIVTCGTTFSSLMSDRLTKRFGTGLVTAVSVTLTAVGIFGDSLCSQFWQLCLFSIPYGLGAGSVDAALNNYVASHYASRHMSWLHGLWGVGTIIGPYVMSFALAGGLTWNYGYRYLSFIQFGIALLMFASLPLWKRHAPAKSTGTQSGGEKALTLRETFRLPGARQAFGVFFCYGALEQTAALWASSYMVLHCGIDAVSAARYASLFYIGITAGRLASGFFTLRFTNRQMIRFGMILAACGAAALFLPLGRAVTIAGLVIAGLGCAPIYPCIIHSIPGIFGMDKSQAVIGILMSACSMGVFLMPPLFGLIANNISVSLYPAYLLGITLVMLLLFHALLKQARIK
ncbi:MAG TPA: MFS transporter [Candidatus Limivivens intestinipullorum]|uniref:MFS transporter n=1 Tax=Candidatus Limivivens intestinipullorum TaxID=2840858 RepID=A0A9D1ET48_9FIRM|nr:MFS transporter [Candidatus Limivivens intestinipullorum]